MGTHNWGQGNRPRRNSTGPGTAPTPLPTTVLRPIPSLRAGRETHSRPHHRLGRGGTRRRRQLPMVVPAQTAQTVYPPVDPTAPNLDRTEATMFASITPANAHVPSEAQWTIQPPPGHLPTRRTPHANAYEKQSKPTSSASVDPQGHMTRRPACTTQQPTPPSATHNTTAKPPSATGEPPKKSGPKRQRRNGNSTPGVGSRGIPAATIPSPRCHSSKAIASGLPKARNFG
jgi:hypothetical protein